jgi:D-alanyl-lipoteichoic acid acyltransferase DltB (MBOAT superfamily)
MTIGIMPVAVNSLPFIAIAIGLAMLAWSRWRRGFLFALAAASLLVALSWAKPLDVLALSLFLIPPYVAVRLAWGKPSFKSAPVILMLIVWEVFLFIYLRKYEWAVGLDWLDHPVAVVGLSYMLFRVIHLLVEAPSLGHLPLSTVRYGAYMLAFWTLLSGPIQRYEAFCKGLEAVGRPETVDVLAASHRAINGLIKAFLIAPVFLKAADLQALGAPGADWLDFAIVFYSYPIYIYLNFSGYTDFMIAIARLCGVNTLPENFNRPYLARNLLDFWARWHISFGTWVRTYVFTPLSTNLIRNAPRSTHNAILAFIVIITFLIVGAWHGTTLNFLLFGLLHAAGILIAGACGRILKAVLSRGARKAFESHPVVHVFSVVLCFHYVAATILLFPNSAADLIAVIGEFAAVGR